MPNHQECSRARVQNLQWWNATPITKNVPDFASRIISGDMIRHDMAWKGMTVTVAATVAVTKNAAMRQLLLLLPLLPLPPLSPLPNHCTHTHNDSVHRQSRIVQVYRTRLIPNYCPIEWTNCLWRQLSPQVYVVLWMDRPLAQNERVRVFVESVWPYDTVGTPLTVTCKLDIDLKKGTKDYITKL